MHVRKLLHNLFEDAYQSIDKRICTTLFLAVETLSRYKQLSIFGLGRTLASPAKVKHNIKRVDRLLGNSNLQAKNPIIYKNISQLLLKGNKRPVIIVDWSGLTRCGAFHFLRAAVAMEGRTLTLYDQAFSLKDYLSDKPHIQFLKTLKNILPDECRPILITDAGFHNPWFRAVKPLGWDFIDQGRVRNVTQYKIEDNGWAPVKSLYGRAKTKAVALSEILLARAQPLRCYFYLVKQKKKYRVKRNLVGKKIPCSVSKKHEKSAREPWLLATSLSQPEINAEKIMQLYKKRIQIEEAFRNLKNVRNGFSLRHSRSFKVERLNILLLIAALAMLFLWLIGLAVKQSHLHFSFQANTEKQRNVLSHLMLGWQAITQNIHFTYEVYRDALKNMTAAAMLEALC